MKKSILLLFIFLAGCGLKHHYPDYIVEWEKQKKDGTWKTPEGTGQSLTSNNQSLPYVGMTEPELERMWGRYGDSTYYSSGIKTVWYTRTMLGMLPGYKGIGNPFYFQRYLIWIKDGKVTNYSIH